MDTGRKGPEEGSPITTQYLSSELAIEIPHLARIIRVALTGRTIQMLDAIDSGQATLDRSKAVRYVDNLAAVAFILIEQFRSRMRTRLGAPSILSEKLSRHLARDFLIKMKDDTVSESETEHISAPFFQAEIKGIFSIGIPVRVGDGQDSDNIDEQGWCVYEHNFRSMDWREWTVTVRNFTNPGKKEISFLDLLKWNV